MLGERFDYALVFAADLHRYQVRKGSPTPYMGHLLAVCSIVLDQGGSEDEAIAALLHDGPEDQGGRATLDLIRKSFGDGVADIVEACSDTFLMPKPPWLERKTSYLASVDTDSVSPSVLLVSAADKLHNLRSTVGDFRSMGEEFWTRFNSTPEQQYWYYSSLSDVYRRRMPGPLAEAVAVEVQALGEAIGHE